MTLLERYRAGEQLAVWDELIARGDEVRSDALREQAEGVAAELVQRAVSNIELVISRLKRRGFRFTGEPLAPPAADADRQAAQLEQLLGPMPLVLRAWYRAAGRVDLRGTAAGWEPPGPLRPGSSYAQVVDPERCYSDPLQVASLGELLAQAEQRSSELEALAPDEGLLLELGGDHLTKRDGPGGTYGLLLPESGIDTDVEAERPTTFAGHLRHALSWGGFPGWAHYLRPPRELLAELRRGLIPF